MANDYDDLPELIESDEDSEDYSDDDSYQCDCPHHHHFGFDESDEEDDDEEERVYPYMVELLHEFLAMNRFASMEPMFVPQKSKTKCKFYMMGKCTKGQFCRFSHDFEPDIPPLIPVNQQQTQSTNTPRTTEQKSTTPCTYYLKGNCLRGNACKFSHSVNVNPQTQQQTTQHPEVSCSICFETVTETKKFGLLNNCNHAFCLECIRGWRKTNQPDASHSNVRSCPLCRTQSDFVIPSPVFPATTEQKDVIVNAYKTSLKNIPCKYFEKYTKCPFGKNCFYLHNGTPQESSNNNNHKSRESRNNSNNSNNSSRGVSPSPVRTSSTSAPPRNTSVPLPRAAPAVAIKRTAAPATKVAAAPVKQASAPPTRTNAPRPPLQQAPRPSVPFPFFQNPLSFLIDSDDEDDEDEDEDDDEMDYFLKQQQDSDDEMPELIEGPLPTRKIETLRAPVPPPAANRTSTSNASSMNNTNTSKRVTRSSSKKADTQADADMPPLVPLQKKSNTNNQPNNMKKSTKKEGSDDEMPSLVPLQKKTNNTRKTKNNNNSKNDSDDDDEMPPLIPLRNGRSKPDSDDEYVEEDEEESEESSSEEEKPAKPPQRQIKKYYARKAEPTNTRRTRSQVQAAEMKEAKEKEKKQPQSKKTRK